MHTALHSRTLHYQFRLLPEFFDDSRTKVHRTLRLLDLNRSNTRYKFLRLGQAVLIQISDHDGFGTRSVGSQKRHKTDWASATDNNRIGKSKT